LDNATYLGIAKPEIVKVGNERGAFSAGRHVCRAKI
jgi:hypothetical protein